MHIGDLAALVFGTAIFVVGALLMVWAVFDGTSMQWATLVDGTEAMVAKHNSVPFRAAAGTWGAALMAPIAWIAVDYARQRPAR